MTQLIEDEKEVQEEQVKKEIKNPLKKDTDLGFIFRFTLVHVLTYFAFGLFAFFAFNYTEGFQSTDVLQDLMRPTDHILVRMGVLFQFIRGPILALAFVLFRKHISEGRYGWLKLFAPLFILTGIGAVNAGPGTIEGWIYTTLPVFSHLSFGLIEVLLQMLAFSLILWKWELKIRE